MGDSSVGGRLANRLKQAGWDGIVIKGTSQTPVGIEIKNSCIEFKNATGLSCSGNALPGELFSVLGSQSFCGGPVIFYIDLIPLDGKFPGILNAVKNIHPPDNQDYGQSESQRDDYKKTESVLMVQSIS